ncbi:Hypothetical predicted protein [Pelobates cultripes]|uniref:Uncharacterized protein n=1 Tax=Pelobates cultripes TaxID=61616 RepID=A0AAD1WXE4_PELCU|nr:Hypothetical predicted protein [Pelobates cultripes]
MADAQGCYTGGLNQLQRGTAVPSTTTPDTLDTILARFWEKLLHRERQAKTLQSSPMGAQDGGTRRNGNPLKGINLSQPYTTRARCPPGRRAKMVSTRRYRPQKQRVRRYSTHAPSLTGRPWTYQDSRFVVQQYKLSYNPGAEGAPQLHTAILLPNMKCALLREANSAKALDDCPEYQRMGLA